MGKRLNEERDKYNYRQMGWIEIVEVNRDARLEPEETFCQSQSTTIDDNRY